MRLLVSVQLELKYFSEQLVDEAPRADFYLAGVRYRSTTSSVCSKIPKCFLANLGGWCNELLTCLQFVIYRYFQNPPDGAKMYQVVLG